jgi:hypothetical protein
MRITSPRRLILVLALSSAAAGLAGCKRSAPEAPKDAGGSASAAAEPAAPFAVSSIELGKGLGPDKRVATPTSKFGPRDTIYAAVSTTGSAPSVVLAARWTYQDGQVVKTDSQTIAPQGPATTEFHISKPSAWPAGKYKVEITANGQSAGSEEFEVGK